MNNNISKIAIIAMGFGDSTLPLVKALSSHGYAVDCYFISFRKKGAKRQSGYDQNGLFYFGLHKLTPQNTEGIDFITDFPQSNFYYCQLLPTAESKNGIIWPVLFFIPRLILYLFFVYLKKKHYDFIDCICQRDFSKLLRKVVKTPFVNSTHEIFVSHQSGNKEIIPTIANCIDYSGYIRVFSKKAYDDLIKYTSISKDKLFCVPFGLFETYLSFIEKEVAELNGLSDYILCIGFITPYKGLDNLYEAIQPIIGNAHLVVAGYGYHESLNPFFNLKNTTVINRWISNNEFVNLIRNCKFVVCPYKSASQSGIPQTAFALGKPIIASAVGAFPDVIENGKTGFIYNPQDIQCLTHCLSTLTNESTVYNQMVSNIKDRKFWHKEYSWDLIVSRYTEMIKKIINDSQ